MVGNMVEAVFEHVSAPEVSPSVEMYLKSIVQLYRGDAPVPTSAVAKELSVSAPSASAMLKRLDVDGYVTHEGRQGVVPTAIGSRIGALTMRRQRLAERWLVDNLKLPWEIAATEACRLEHSISPLVERHLSQFLGDPTTCPHGHPIPTVDGMLWRHERAIELSDLPIGVETPVLEVPHDMPELLKFLADIDLRPDVRISVLQRDRIVGLLTLAVGEREQAVSVQLASSILVRYPL
jgi:DtxR family Mn-dependent transcriptional regulator